MKLLEDLTEITKKDHCDGNTSHANSSFQSDFSSHHDSGLGGANGAGAAAAAVNKENASPNKKSGPLARKSLNASEAWGASTSATAAATGNNVLSRGSEASFTNPETPSKSLLGTDDNSVVFTPPSILKDTLSGAANHRSSASGGAAGVSPPDPESGSTGSKSGGPSGARGAGAARSGGAGGQSPPKSKL